MTLLGSWPPGLWMTRSSQQGLQRKDYSTEPCIPWAWFGYGVLQQQYNFSNVVWGVLYSLLIRSLRVNCVIRQGLTMKEWFCFILFVWRWKYFYDENGYEVYNPEYILQIYFFALFIFNCCLFAAAFSFSEGWQSICTFVSQDWHYLWNSPHPPCFCCQSTFCWSSTHFTCKCVQRNNSLVNLAASWSICKTWASFPVL